MSDPGIAGFSRSRGVAAAPCPSTPEGISEGVTLEFGAREDAATLIHQAFGFASKRLSKVRRPSTKEPAIFHAIRVAKMVRRSAECVHVESLIVALLHDVIEDAGVTEAEIASHFGPSVASAVVILSKPRIRSRARRRSMFHDGVIQAPDWMIRIKLADLYDNLMMRAGTHRGRRTARRAIQFLDRFERKRSWAEARWLATRVRGLAHHILSRPLSK